MILIGNGNILTDKEIINDGAVCIENNLILEVGQVNNLKQKYPKAKYIDAKGGIIMPGLVNCHMHLYSTFARGMSIPGNPPTNFVEILDKLWWKLDKTLTKEDIYYSALIPLFECVKSGTTTIIDHHASPNFVKGSLSVIKQALDIVPVRSCLCYEVSDRDGEKIARNGIEENASFIEEHKENNMLSGLFGLHASFTVSDNTLKECKKIADKLGTGFHVHTAEDIADVKDSKEKYGCGVVERFDKNGILGDKTVLAHCVHISDKEIEILARTKTNVVHNPESNMNNAVGCSDINKMLDKNVLVGLGTDGMTSDMFQEAKFAHLIRKHVEKNPQKGFCETGKMLFENNYKILSNILNDSIGGIKKGALADIIILDYKSATPINKDNFLGHFLYAMNSNCVNSTIINGKLLMHDKELIGIDENGICKESQKYAQKLWNRIVR